MLLSKLLREKREGSGETQKDLALFLGVSEKSVKEWEKGKSIPGASYWSRIMSKYEITQNEIKEMVKSHGFSV